MNKFDVENITQLSLSDIIAYKRNPRINRAAIEHVKNSLLKHSQVKPVILSAPNHPFQNSVLCCGHTVYKALQELSVESDEFNTIKAIYHKFRDEREFIDYNIRDNKTHEFSDWDYGLLDELVEEFQIDLFDMGFPDLGENDPATEWRESNMPDYENKDMRGIRLVVHFGTVEDRKEFADLIGQSITDKTKSIWYPKQEQDKTIDLQYVSA